MRLLHKILSFLALLWMFFTLLSFIGNKESSSNSASVPRSTSNRAVSFVLDEYRRLYDQWMTCAHLILDPLKNDANKVWYYSTSLAQECGDPLLKKLNSKQFPNKDEMKYHILPNGGKSTVVTLGIGHDIDAETKMRQVLGVNTSEFFGADPMVEINEQLYSSIGKFFPFAVSSKAGKSSAFVLDGDSYKTEQLVHVEMIDFLKNHAQRKFIDQLLLDVEGAEYGLFPYFYKKGKFDENGVIICQMNMEIHTPDQDGKRMIHDFIFRLLQDERYAILHAVKTTWVPWYYVGHLRLYIVNMEHPECVRKYLSL